MAFKPEDLLEITLKLKKLTEGPPVGPSVASQGKTLVPSELLDIVWKIVMGDNKDGEGPPGAVFVLGMWKEHPIVGWQLRQMPLRDLVALLATTIALVGERSGKSVVEPVIQMLRATQERKDLEKKTEGQNTQ